MKKISLVFLAIILFALPTAFAQANKLETAKRVEQTDKRVKPIEAYAKTIEDFVEKEMKPHLVIADVSDYNESDKPIWKDRTFEEESEKPNQPGEEAYTVAYIWKKEGKVIATNITYSSPSGDWAQYVYYIFREDGSVAKIDRELRTFMGDIIVNRIHIYDENGELLKETKNFRDLETQKPIKEPESFQDIDVDIYLKINDLPFADMLSSETKSKSASSSGEEDFIPNGWKLEDKQTGDLNGDSLPDSVLQIIKENSEDEDGDYNRSLIILFKNQNGTFTKAAEAKKIIRCTSCGGVLGGSFADVKIEKGILIISQLYGSREATDYLHRFRFEPSTKKFLLIGEDITNYDRATGESETTSTNYLTGKQIVTKEKYNKKTDKQVVVSKQTKNVFKSKRYIEDIDYNNY